MIKRIYYYLFSFFVSVEFLILLIGILLWIIKFDSVYSKISEVLFKSNDLSAIGIQVGIPVAILGISYGQFKYILQPDMNLKIFYTWEDYIKLKDTFITGLIWNLLAVVSALILVFICPNSSNQTKGAFYTVPLIASLFSTITLIFARQRLKEIIEKNKDENKPVT